jgi:hypothetical protein
VYYNENYGIYVFGVTTDNTEVMGNHIHNNSPDNLLDQGTNTFYQTATNSDPLNQIGPIRIIPADLSHTHSLEGDLTLS